MKLLNTEQTAKFLDVTVNTVNQWRYLKRGPQYRKIGANVRYAEEDLIAYLDGQIRTGTSHQGKQVY